MSFTLNEQGIYTTETAAISYPESGNSNSFQVEDKSYWFAHRNQIILAAINRFQFKNNYADIGGGNGFQANEIQKKYPDRKVFLVEPGMTGCINARKRKLENVYNCMFQDFDFEANKVDAVSMFDVIEHIEDDVTFIKDLAKKLPNKSLMYITVPAYNFLRSDVDDFGGHYRRHTISSLKKMAENAGVEFVYGSYFFTYIPPLTFALRSIPYRIKGARSQKEILAKEDNQHNPSSTILSVFNKFHQYELSKIKNSSIPFGASVLGIFKKK